MKRIFLTLGLLLFVTYQISAQTVQWATEVLEFSSELTPIQYSAKQILGKPNVLPAGGESPNAWTPDRPDRKEFIKVGFENPINIKQIAIAESYNPSALYKIFVYDTEGNEYLINTFRPRTIPYKGRMLNMFLQETSYKVAAIKMEFDGAAVPDYFSIDAIAISDSDIPIVAVIDIPDAISEEIYIERLSENVNSRYKEYKPLLSPDGATLYFSRKNHPQNVGGEEDPEDIWYSEWDSTKNEWALARNLRELNNEGPNFISSVTPDGKTVVLLLGNRYLDNGNMMAGLSFSSNEGGSWSEPQDVEIENDYNFSEKANYFLTNSRKSIIMSVEREDTEGGRDLYVSFLQPDSTWSEPLHMGDIINSAGEESSPFLAADDKTLYFSSDGFSGFGGTDVFVTTRLDDTWTNWTEPENLGPDVNSELEDLFFNIPATSEYAYYSRGVSEEDTDIFRVEMPLFKRPDPVILVKGKLIDSKTKEPIEAKIVYERLPDGKELGMIKSNPETGEFELLLPAGEQYSIRAEAEGYIAETIPLDLREEKRYDITIDQQTLQLVPIEEKAVVTLNSVFFDFDKATLKEESKPELNRIVKLMNEREGMVIEIRGHTDATGPEDYNMQLSKRRAMAVQNYLKSQGIDPERLNVEYFGESKPIATNETAEGRKLNRRVEFEIVKE
ncbi:MAG: OmpA family protein [Candidatus Cyclobacteriaceae bacterium M2_1C_046]